MKRIFFITTGILILISGFTIILFLSFIQRGNINSDKINFSFLRNGDLILRRGRSVESFAVYALDKNRDYSHIGIVVIENGSPFIIHVVPDKPDLVRKESPAVFLSDKNASHFKIIRSDFQPERLKAVAETALSFYKKQLIFDNKYDLSTDDKLYCSELIMKAFGKNKIYFPDIVPQKLRLIIGTYFVIMPGTFLENSHFTGIENR